MVFFLGRVVLLPLFMSGHTCWLLPFCERKLTEPNGRALVIPLGCVRFLSFDSPEARADFFELPRISLHHRVEGIRELS